MGSEGVRVGNRWWREGRLGVMYARSKLLVGKAFNHPIPRNSFTRLNERYLLA